MHHLKTACVTVKSLINAGSSLHLTKLSGNIDHKVVPMSPLLDLDHCSQSAEWSSGFPGAVCDQTINFHRLSFNDPTPSSLKAKDVILANSHGIKITHYFYVSVFLKNHLPICNHDWPLVVINEDYSWPWQRIKKKQNRSYRFDTKETQDHVIVSC